MNYYKCNNSSTVFNDTIYFFCWNKDNLYLLRYKLYNIQLKR